MCSLRKHDLPTVSLSLRSLKSPRRFSAVISPPTTSSSSPAPETRRPQFTKSSTELLIGWIKKYKNELAGAEAFPCTADCTERRWLRKTKDSQLLLCSFVYVCERKGRGREAWGRKSHISGYKRTLVLMLWECWLVYSCAKIVDSSKELLFICFPFFCFF